MKTFNTILIGIILLKSGLVYSQLTEPINTDYVKFIPETKELVLDGKDDEAYWSEARTMDVLFCQPVDFGGDSDLSGSFKFFFSAYGFYFYGNIVDDISHCLDDIDGYSWMFDNVELFFNIDTAGTDSSGKYAPDGIQLRFNRGLLVTDGLPGFGNGEVNKTDGLFNNPLLQYAQTETDSGWTLEAEIPWKYILPEGSLPEDIFDYINKHIGFDVSFGDSDDPSFINGARDAQIAWDGDGGSNDEDNAWQDVRKFGILELLVDTADIKVHAETCKDTIIETVANEYKIHLDSKYSYGTNFTPPASYKWASLNSVEIADSAAAALKVTINSPILSEEYAFVLEITDKEGNKDSDTMFVSFTNLKPIAIAGNDQTVSPNDIVKLDGSQSYSFIGDTITYSWESLDGIDLAGTNQADPVFIAPDLKEDRTYRFVLTVDDGTFKSLSDTVVVILDGFTHINKALENTISISPNPATDYLSVNLGEIASGKLFLEIIDINGRALLKKDMPSQMNIFNLSSIQYKGFAIVRIINELGDPLHSDIIIIQ